MMLMGFFASLVTFIFVLFLAAGPAHAQKVESIKGNRVLIDAQDLPIKPHQIWELIGDHGETTGEVTIMQVRDGQAVGQITLGFANPGFILRLKAEPSQPKVRHRRWFTGFSSLDTVAEISVEGTKATLKGTQFGLQIGADQILTPRQLLRARIGFDLVNTKGSIANPPGCEGVSDCKLWVHYLTGALGYLFQAFPVESSFNLGITTGFSAFLPISRTSDSIDPAKIGLDGGLEIGAVVQFKTNPITWIELSAQRIFLRSTDTLDMKLIRYNLTWMQYF